MSFTFAPLVGVEYFRAFFGRERCILCFCALKKIASRHTLKEIVRKNVEYRSKLPVAAKNSGENGDTHGARSLFVKSFVVSENVSKVAYKLS